MLGMDRSDADSSACERWEGCEKKQEVEGEGSSHVKSDSPCLSQEESPGRRMCHFFVVCAWIVAIRTRIVFFCKCTDV